MVPKSHLHVSEHKWALRTLTARDCCQERRRGLVASVPLVTRCNCVHKVIRQHLWVMPSQRIIAHTQRIGTSCLSTHLFVKESLN